MVANYVGYVVLYGIIVYLIFLFPVFINLIFVYIYYIFISTFGYLNYNPGVYLP